MAIEDLILARLETGHFAKKANDVVTAQRLKNGRFDIAGTVLEVYNPETFEESSSLSRSHSLILHSLRWADPLRRACAEVPDAMEAWSKIFASWSASGSARTKGSVAWASAALQQRSVALALAASESTYANDAIPGHIEALTAVEQRAATAERRLRLLEIRLGLSARRGDPDDALRALAVASAQSTFSDDGYAVAEDLGGIAAVAERWLRVLRDLGVPREAAVFAQLRSPEFWLHNLAPDGSLIPMGTGLPTQLPRTGDSRMRYAVTGGVAGSPPTELGHVNPRGPVSFRSGWGGAERNVREETLATMILGPVRGREAHADLARVTYHSQGRHWLIDPTDEVAAGPEFHSTVTIGGVRYRPHGQAELAERYAGRIVDGVVVKNTVYSRVRWQRRMTFVRTGNYMVVEDALQSAQEYAAYQQWIIAPDVDIEPSRQGFLMHAEGKTVAVIVSAYGLKNHVIDTLTSKDGSKIAWRIRVPIVAPSHRAVAVVIDVIDPGQFRVRRTVKPGKEIAISILDHQLHDVLVLTPDGVTVF